MSPLKVLLINPGQLYFVSPPSPIQLPVKPALLALFSALKRGGIADVQVLDLDLEELPFPSIVDELGPFAARCAGLLADIDYDVAAISCFSTFSFQSTLLLASLSKEVHPRSLVVVGGWHGLSEAAGFADADGSIDVVVRGPGEQVLLEIAQGGLRSPGGTPLVVDAPRLTHADHAHFEYLLRRYVENAPARYAERFREANAVILPTSRGCPYACRFCGNSLHPHRDWLPLGVSECLLLLDEARRVLPALDSFYLGDAYFGASRVWRRELLEGLGRSHPDLPYVVITRVETLEGPDIDLLARSPGFVLLGVESLSSTILQVMHKTRFPEQYIARTKEVVSQLRANGVPHELFLILDHPGETAETMETTRAHLELLAGPLTTMVGFRYMPYPQFAHDYDEYQKRFGTELLGPLQWWRQPAFYDSRALMDRYVPSKLPGESFTGAKERLGRPLALLANLCEREARAIPHGNVVRQLGRGQASKEWSA